MSHTVGQGRRAAAHYTAAMVASAADFGFSPPARREIPAARAMAVALMDHDVASLQTFEAVLDLQPASLLTLQQAGEVLGVVATLFLRASVEPILLDGRFDGMDFDLGHLSRAVEAPAFYYIWGIAGATKPASSAVMGLSRRLRYDALCDLPAYALAATPVGRHVGITQLGFRPVRYPDDDLLVSPSVLAEAAA